MLAPSFRPTLAALLTASALLAAPALASPLAHFQECVAPTAASASIVLALSSGTSDLASLQSGDELAIFTPEGVCAGAGVWNGHAMAVAVWADLPFTEEVEGFSAGESLSFRVWQAATGTEFSSQDAVVVEFDSTFSVGDGFDTDAVFVVSNLQINLPTSAPTDEVLAYALDPNFPNPFTSETTIRYALPRPGPVRLDVYDLTGRLVRTLVDEDQSAGRHEALLHGTDLATGAYVYRLVSGDFVAHHRLTLIR